MGLMVMQSFDSIFNINIRIKSHDLANTQWVIDLLYYNSQRLKLIDY